MERERFAARCHTSVGYLRKAVSTRQQLGVELCLHLDRESEGVLRCERLFPGLDWEYLRQVACREPGANGVVEACATVMFDSTDKPAPQALGVPATGAISSEAKEAAHA